ncbi:MAG: glycosyltransferase, partial [Candidatus Binatia bacterium]
SRPPDEVIVCDDASSDDTGDMLESFAATSAFPVRILRNDERIGAPQSFARAVAACGGRWIALADQDDAWHPAKLERSEAMLLAAPDTAAVFSDAALMDEDGRRLAGTLWQAIGFGSIERRELEVGRGFQALLRRNWVTGACLVFRAALRDLILPIPEGWVQDEWIALVVSAGAPIRPIEALLVRYRQHPGQLIGARRRASRPSHPAERRRAAADQVRRFEALVSRLAMGGGLDGDRARALEEKLGHAELRARMPGAIHRRLPVILGELARRRYHRYSEGWRSAAADLIG